MILNHYKSLLRVYFLKVYPPEGCNPTFRPDRWYITRTKQINASKDNLRLLSSFLGLPNQTPKLDDKLTWATIGKNFIGWKGGWFYKIFLPLITLYNLIAVLVSIPLNILRLVTEFIPGAIIGLGEILDKYSAKDSPLEIVAKALQWLFHPILFVGRAITSPTAAVMGLWDNFKKQRGIYALGYFALLCASLFITTASYSVLFPLAVKLLAATIFPALPTILTGVMGFLLPAYTAVGNGLIFALFGFSMPAVSSLAAYIGFAAINTFALTLIGSIWQIFDKEYGVGFHFKKMILNIGKKIEPPQTPPIDHDESYKKMQANEFRSESCSFQNEHVPNHENNIVEDYDPNSDDRKSSQFEQPPKLDVESIEQTSADYQI